MPCCDLGVMFDLGFAEMFAVAIFETFFYHQDISIVKLIIVCAFT